jgi:hypothetical protein
VKTAAACALALALAACAGTAPPVEREAPIPPAPLAAEEYGILGPFAHENLSVFLIEKRGAPAGDDEILTLEEALKEGSLRVTEVADGAQVNRLEVENVGGRPVYLQAGDTVKGGRQDRAIGIDFILRPRSGRTAIDVFCVEPGRWAHRMADFPGVDISLVTSVAPAATKEQKLAIKGAQSQAQLWEAGRATNSLLALNAQSFTVQESYVLAIEDPKVRESTEAYVRALQGAVEGKRDLVGMAYAINGEPNSAEIYATSSLFLKLWPKLLRGAAVEALAKKPPAPGAKAAAPPDIAAFLGEAGRQEGRLRTLSEEIRVRAYAGETVSLFDTERDGRLLHRQVIRR